MKRLTIIALIVLLIAGVFVSCNEENIVDDEFIPPIDITSETRTFEAGNKYRTTENTTIPDRLTVEGEGKVTIILTEGTTLTAEKGINVTDDQEIIIKGTGKLVATGDPKSAGIGGGDGEDGGTVRIQGGDITANGGNGGGAGIGGGKGGKSGTTIIEKKEGKAAPDVKTKGGKETSHGIGNGDGVTEDPEEVKLNGMDLEVSNDGEFWEDYDGDNPEQYMRSYVPVIVTFNANGGTGSMPAQKIHAGVATTLNANAYTRTGMSFKGWNTAKDGSGKAYANKASVTLTEDVTLYAQWEVAPTGNYITAETTTIQSGLTWTIQDNVVNPNRISIEGTDETAIILPEGLKLEVKQGISVSTGQTLIIDGTGSLVAGEDITGAYGKSGIGGADQYDLGGTIIINSGNITAYGGETGIGGKNYPDYDPLPAEGTLTIEINGGVINATGNGSGGIGGFRANISINGGDIHATDDLTGAGIGGLGCSITINGGKVHATGKSTGAGIGSSGIFEVFDSSQKITITGGEITAIGGQNEYGYTGAGIGGGYDCGSGTITISGGTIIATGGSAEANGIGNGCNHSGTPDINLEGVYLSVSANGTDWSPYTDTPNQYMKTDNVTLDKIVASTTTLEVGKTYTVDCSSNSNRIAISGSGSVTIILPASTTLTLSQGITVAEGQTLTITGYSSSKLYATGLGGNAAIGGAYGGTLGTIIINGGNITANKDGSGSGGGAGIGNGAGATNGGVVIINGGKVVATGSNSTNGGAGIGGGQSATTAPVSITINGGEVTATGAKCAAGIGGAWHGSCDVTINGGEVTATGGEKYSLDVIKNAGGPGIGCGQKGASATVNITGGLITATGKGGGAGIGGAGDWDPVSTIVINISGGRITATGSTDTIDAITYAAAGIGGSYHQPSNDSSGTGSLTITLSGSPEIKGIGATADARGFGRGNGTAIEANLIYDDLDVGLQSDDTDSEDYYPYDYYGNRQYMKTSNYHN